MPRSNDRARLCRPGRLDQLTGGYLYDRHVIDGLRSRGHGVKVIELGPDDCEMTLAELADGTTTVIDGLALPDFEQAVIAEWRRLRLVALVHHPGSRLMASRPSASS
jgi:hypothetical protein